MLFLDRLTMHTKSRALFPSLDKNVAYLHSLIDRYTGHAYMGYLRPYLFISCLILSINDTFPGSTILAEFYSTTP